ncbi:MAG: 1-phosphofructokinase family hexose kinase [Gemmatimonadota bacterium]
MDPIAVLTMNPAVDVSARVPRVEPEVKIRTERPRRDPGGGGVNVSRALKRMGVDAPSYFPAGGPAGDLLEQLLEGEGVSTVRIPIDDATRESFTFDEEDGDRQYRFVMPGPELREDECETVLELLAEADPRPSWLVASGSLPPGVPSDFYARLARHAREHDARLVLDTSGPALREALEEGVYLVKPNARELGEAVGRDIGDEGEQEEAARALLENGAAEIVVVSLGPSGALAVTKDSCMRIRSPSVRPRSRVGAGDSTVAGIVRGLARGDDLASAVKLGVAAGAAAVMTPGTELCEAAEVERLYQQLRED